MRNKIVKQITLSAIYVALLAIFSWISIPSTIPFTLQTLMIFIICYTLDCKNAICVIIIYLLLGLVGVPVFSSFNSGLSALLGPSGGFLIGFIPMILIISLLIKNNKENDKITSIIYKVLVSFLGLLICYIIGLIWFMFIYKAPYDVTSALFKVILPFIIPDTIKMIIALIVSKKIKQPLN